MIKVLSVEHMRRVEAAADASGLSYAAMMQRAGQAVAERALALLTNRPDARVTLLIGGGNNGGDGLVAGRIIAEKSSALVRFYLLKPRPESDENLAAVRSAGLFVAYASDDRDFRVLRNMVASADILVDALFGIGVRLPLTGEAAKVMRVVRQALDQNESGAQQAASIDPADPGGLRHVTRPYVLAVDCPSGIDCDTGALDAQTPFADETITFIAAKPGLFQFPGAAAVGQLRVAPIGVPADLPEMASEKRILVDADAVRTILPRRPVEGNKGTFGKALIVAGSDKYVGAAGLAAMAAYRVGAGLVMAAVPRWVASALSSHLFEPTWLPLEQHDLHVGSGDERLIGPELSRYDAVLIGPGLGLQGTTQEFLIQFLRRVQTVRTENAGSPSEQARYPQLVIDADGLNLLSRAPDWWKLVPAGSILTPHPGEMGRLVGMSAAEVQAGRWHIAEAKAAEWQVVVVLKGAHTLIAAPDGRVAVLPFKTDALATAGTGDVLAGAIVGLLAQGLPAYEAAVAGSYIHGLAGVQAAQRVHSSRSVIASDVLDALGSALGMIETG